MLSGFFVGWPDPPSPERHLQILKNSRFVVIAVDDQASRVVGFVNAVSDGILSAYIPLLEVLPDHPAERNRNRIGEADARSVQGVVHGGYDV